LRALPDQARNLDAELDTHLTELGMIGHHFVQLKDGRAIRLPAYLEETFAAFIEWGLQP